MPTTNILFGAGVIGEGRISHTWVEPSQVSDLLRSLEDLGLKQLDSAASYPPGSPWVPETLLGESRAAELGFVIDSKILATGNPPGAGHLSQGNIKSSLKRTLDLLYVEKVNILYAHGPDPVTPVEETAQVFDEEYRAGKFEKWGLCNHTTAQVERYLAVCDQHGYLKPKFIQGDYNALRRGFEKSLNSLLRKNDIKFIAFGPLASGFITSKVTLPNPDIDLSQSRWAPGRHPMYPKIFDRPVVHESMRKFIAVCETNGLTSTEASLRWIMHHSALEEGDGIILGATRVDQLRANVEAIKKGPLPEAVLKGLEDMWESVRPSMGEPA